MFFNINNYHHKLLFLQGFLHITAITGLIYLWDPVWLLVSLVAKFLFYNLGTEIVLNRLTAHRSFKTQRWKQRLLLTLSMFGGYGNSLTWAANHRVHHQNSDEDGDPHPSREWFKTWFWIGTNKKARVSAATVKDLIKEDPYHKLQRDYYFWIVYGVYAITALVSLKFLVYFFLVPGMLAMHAGGLINVVCHKWGYRNFETSDLSRNNIWVNLYSYLGGVGLHNNHHHNPRAWNLKMRPGEIDLSAWIIKRFLMIEEEKKSASS